MKTEADEKFETQIEERDDVGDVATDMRFLLIMILMTR